MRTVKLCALGVATFLICTLLSVVPAYAASLTGSSPGSGAVVSGSSVTFTLSFSNNVAGNEAWATNQSAFSVYDDNGTYYPCAPSRNYFGNTPGDTPDPEGMRRLIFVTVSSLQPGMHYTLSGVGLYTQGHVAIPAFNISFSTDGQPESPEPEPSEPEVPDSGDGNGETGEGTGGGAGNVNQGDSGSDSESGDTPDASDNSAGNEVNTHSQQHSGSQDGQMDAPEMNVTSGDQQKPVASSQKESTQAESAHVTEVNHASGDGSQALGGTHYYAVKDLVAAVPEEEKGEEVVVTAIKPLLLIVVALILLGSLVRSTTWFANKNRFVYEGMRYLRGMRKKH